LPHLLALAGILIISFSAILVRLAGVSPSTAAFYRVVYAAPVLVAGWLATRRFDRRTGRERALAAVAGLILAADLTLWHTSIVFIGAGLSTVLASTQVVIVGLAAWALHGERPTRAAMALVPAVLTGVAMISGLGRPDAYGARPVAGTILAVLAGAAYASFLLVFRASNRSASPPVGPLMDATLGSVAGAAIIGPLLDPGFSLAVTWPAHGWLATLALAPHVTGWLLITAALPRLPALETSVMLLGQPVLTVLWGLLVFGEWLSGVQWTGVALVLAGVGWLGSRGSVEERAAPSQPPPSRRRP